MTRKKNKSQENDWDDFDDVEEQTYRKGGLRRHRNKRQHSDSMEMDGMIWKESRKKGGKQDD